MDSNTFNVNVNIDKLQKHETKTKYQIEMRNRFEILENDQHIARISVVDGGS